MKIRASTVLVGLAVLALLFAIVLDRVPVAGTLADVSFGVFGFLAFAGLLVTLGTLLVDRSPWRFIELAVAALACVLISIMFSHH